MRLSLTAATVFLSLLSMKPCFADNSDSRTFHIQTGEASYYAQSRNNFRTSSGERFDSEKFTAAHYSLPLGTWVKVTNLLNGRSVKVRINDRNAPSETRIIDLSQRAAKEVGMIQAGIAQVRIERTSPPRIQKNLIKKN